MFIYGTNKDVRNIEMVSEAYLGDTATLDAAVKVDISVKPKLVYESNGTLRVQKYECGDYLIKVVYNGIDTVASIFTDGRCYAVS